MKISQTQPPKKHKNKLTGNIHTVTHSMATFYDSKIPAIVELNNGKKYKLFVTKDGKGEDRLNCRRLK